MKLSQLPQPLQELAIKRMKQQFPLLKAYPDDDVDSLFVFSATPEAEEWQAVINGNLEPMYAKRPKLRS